MSRRLAVLAALLTSGCSSAGPPTSPSEPQPAYRPVASVLQTMEWILDPAADAIWDSAGFVLTEQGETDLSPTTDEGWERVRNGATVVAETGNLLLMPGRSPGPDWVGYAQALTEAGVVAMAAAEAKDAGALFAAGGQLYQACRDCHDQYMVPLHEARGSP